MAATLQSYIREMKRVKKIQFKFVTGNQEAITLSVLIYNFKKEQQQELNSPGSWGRQATLPIRGPCGSDLKWLYTFFSCCC